MFSEKITKLSALGNDLSDVVILTAVSRSLCESFSHSLFGTIGYADAFFCCLNICRCCSSEQIVCLRAIVPRRTPVGW